MCKDCGCHSKNRESKYARFIHEHEHSHGDVVHSHPHDHDHEHQHEEGTAIPHEHTQDK